MKLTIFAGTFNPIHTGHLILAESVRTSLNLEKIVFIPSYTPPHRENDLADPEARMQMVKLAIADNPAFEVDDIEFKLKGKSYTLNTINRLYKSYPEIKGKINFIIGTDAFMNLENWYYPEKLSKLVNFIVIARYSTPDTKKIINASNIKNIDYTLIETPIIEISSSLIRNRIKNNKSVKYLVSEPVRNYMTEKHLYL